MKEVVGLHSGMFLCPNRWTDRLPPETLRPDREEAVGRFWDLLALTPEGCAHLTGCCPRCRVLLLPGNCRMMGMADTVITYGLSSRDSLTLSSLEEPVLPSSPRRALLLRLRSRRSDCCRSWCYGCCRCH